MIDATEDPMAFVDAVEKNQKVFADFADESYLSWDGENILYVFPHKGGEMVSLFPALFKRSDEDMNAVFAFYDALHREMATLHPS